MVAPRLRPRAIDRHRKTVRAHLSRVDTCCERRRSSANERTIFSLRFNWLNQSSLALFATRSVNIVRFLLPLAIFGIWNRMLAHGRTAQWRQMHYSLLIFHINCERSAADQMHSEKFASDFFSRRLNNMASSVFGFTCRWMTLTTSTGLMLLAQIDPIFATFSIKSVCSMASLLYACVDCARTH